jgi:hypothetical protein
MTYHDDASGIDFRNIAWLAVADRRTACHAQKLNERLRAPRNTGGVAPSS